MERKDISRKSSATDWRDREGKNDGVKKASQVCLADLGFRERPLDVFLADQKIFKKEKRRKEKREIVA